MYLSVMHLCSKGQGGSICLWVSLTGLNSEEITLCSDSVELGDSGCVHLPLVSVSSYMHWYFLIFAFESQWQHWTVKRSLCALTVLARGVHLPLCLIDNIEQWRDHSVLWQGRLGGSICLWCLYLYICTGISLYFLISAFESQWQHWTVKRSLCALTVLARGVHLPLCLIDNIEYWRDHSVLWQCWAGVGGLSAFGVCIFIYALVFSLYFLISWLFWMGSHLLHWTAKSSLHPLAVFNGGSICLCCLYLYICTGISLYFLISWLFQMGSHLHHWTVKSSLCPLAVSNGGLSSVLPG